MKPKPPITDWSGLLGSGVPSVSTRTSTISASTIISGMATLQKVSMPLLTPR